MTDALQSELAKARARLLELEDEAAELALQIDLNSQRIRVARRELQRLELERTASARPPTSPSNIR